MNLLNFDLNLLRILDALLQEKSTIKAGERVGLSQPAVSAALGRLRSALGDPLFVRQGQALVATDFALGLELPVRRILDDITETLSDPTGFDPSRSTQNYILSGTDYFSEMLMPELAQRVGADGLNMTFQLLDSDDDQIVRDIETGKVDLAFVRGIDTPNWIERQRAFRSQFAAIAARGNPVLAKAGIAEGDLIPLDLYCEMRHAYFSPLGDRFGLADAELATLGHKRHIAMTLPGFTGVMSVVAGSDLIATVPDRLVERLAPRLNLGVYRLPLTQMSAEIDLIWHKRATRNPAHGWLRDTVLDILEAQSDTR